MKLYGTYTSPFVRRVRIVAEEVGAPYTLVDSSKDEGQAALRAITPIWKVPVAELDGTVILDSHVIVDFLLESWGHRKIRTVTSANRWREKNIHNVIDGALDSAINLFYLKRDGASEDIAYLAKQKGRVEAAMDWIEKQLDDGWFTDERRIGLTEIALVTAIDWMTFRDAYPVTRHPGLARFRDVHRDVASFTSTAPRL
ncbi:glutathione S-transferase family protein [Myxococcota bacterium]|nr:glutathione S-transferase family protein [Myxococcota bacterium]